ncbi:MAG: 6-carboxytetrahydropterin synthase [Bacteroidetes bacterium]|nr:6-carboxytetrahydropterin synthase [Bacteroidota bacterium]
MTRTLRIAREFHWEMGHRLPFHLSGCANIHGHSYKLWVEIEGHCDANGMMIDYGEMKQLVMPVIDEFDHCFLCDENDDVMLRFLKTTNFKFKVVSFTTTAENLVFHFLDRLWELFSVFPQISGLRLRLQETDISYAEAGRTREQ